MKDPITVTILTKNSGDTLLETLRSVQDFHEVIILDTGSTDDTLEIAAEFPHVKIHHAEFKGFGPLHNEATSLASSDWILSIDSDESLTPELVTEIQGLKLHPDFVYSVQRDNYFNGKRIRCCAGWYPDRIVRLYNRKQTKFSNDAVHERILTQGLNLLFLKHPLKHIPYRSISDFLDKMQKYSTLFAQQNRGKKKSSFCKALVHGLAAFCKNYFLKLGIFGGKEGFIISLYNSQTAYYKYLKLAELSKKL
ncbi:MAG: glycosyltransferase family 2 protein [Verrucomicrobia bacterium]|nr:glycosyltransferase family 2 protein [Verrucomicrobiota bacterium]